MLVTDEELGVSVEVGKSEEEDDANVEVGSDEDVEGGLGGIVGHGKYSVMYEVPAQLFVQELVQL